MIMDALDSTASIIWLVMLSSTIDDTRLDTMNQSSSIPRQVMAEGIMLSVQSIRRVREPSEHRIWKSQRADFAAARLNVHPQFLKKLLKAI